MIEHQERTEAPVVTGDSPEPPPRRNGPGGPAILAVAVLAGALAGGGVAAAVTLNILHSQARTNPQSVDLRNNVTISASDAVTNVATKALPAMVTVVTGSAADGSPTGASGFLVTSDGYVVTTIPVVSGASRLVVYVAGDAKPHLAHLIDYDCPAGFAVLKADGITGAPTLAFGDSTAVRPGETLVALGRGLQGPEVAETVASSLNRTGYFQDPADSLRQVAVSGSIVTGGRLLEGAGGSAILNVGGQVVGIALPAEVGTPTTAVAAALVQAGVQQVVSGGQLTVAGLGASWTDIPDAQAVVTGGPGGARLDAVDAGGPAALAGLLAGDVVTQVDDVVLNDAHPLALDLRSRFQPGQRVTITYVRSGTSSQVQLTLAAQHPACA